MNGSPSQALPALPDPERRGGWAVAVAVAVTLATVGAILAGGGPALAAVPALLAGVVFAVFKVPLRYSTAALLFLLLGVDDLGENIGQIRTPLAIVGSLLHYRIDDITGVPGLAVSGMEVAIALLLLAWSHRRSARDASESAGRVPSPTFFRGLLLVLVAVVVLADLHGLARGQAAVPWKVRNLVHPVLFFLLFDAAFRGPVDNRLIARAVVASAVFRALLALVVQRTSVALTGGKFATATSHGDSLLFAAAFFIVLADLSERLDMRRVARAALLLPILGVGMIENSRRLVWVMVAMAFGVAYLASPWRGWKRRLTMVVVASLPLLVVYVAVGWDSQSRLFSPVRTLRGVADTSYDHSAYWREVENWNIAMTLRSQPVLGLGLGARYVEHMPNDDISSLYREYREWPHNTVLGMLMLLGPLGFAAVWALPTAALFLAFRVLRRARLGEHRVAALACVATLVSSHVLAYGDTGAHYDQYKILLALAAVVAGKLAVACGAWPAPRAGTT